MRLQSSQASCGAAAVHNALCALGREPSLEACEKACRVDATDGTSPKRLVAGVKAMGGEVVAEIKERESDVGLLRLDKATTMGLVGILVVDADSHWVTVVGRLGDRYLVADSADSELIRSLSAKDLVERWKGEGRKPYYAVLVGAP